MILQSERSREAVMSEAIPPILYDRPATFQKWPSLEARRLATGDTIHAQPVFEGTLAGCIRDFLTMPITQRTQYEIFTDRQPGLRDTILSANYILEISRRADFPKDSSPR
jgi:hypothetical protein